MSATADNDILEQNKIYQNDMCDQRILRSVCASAHSQQRLRMAFSGQRRTQTYSCRQWRRWLECTDTQAKLRRMRSVVFFRDSAQRWWTDREPCVWWKSPKCHIAWTLKSLYVRNRTWCETIVIKLIPWCPCSFKLDYSFIFDNILCVKGQTRK